jgi:signal transduction histidine kinase
MIGHTMAEFIDPGSLSAFKTRQSRQNHKKMTPYELVFAGSNGDKLWVKVSPKAIFDDDKNFVGSFSVLSDITQYIKFENELQASGAALQRLSKDVLQAQEVERKRISAELHDGLGQTLSAIKFCMENVANGSSPEETDQDRRIVVDRRKQFETVIERMQSAIEEVRRISMDLRPTLLDDIGILATLSWFCRESSHSYKDLKIALNVSAILEKDVPESIKVPVFRIVQEAVNNVVKHSKAKEVDINFGKMKDGQIWLSIDDNGSGFVQNSIHGINDVGIGLKTMQERARNSGGDFQLKSSRGRGTHIQVFWPPVN